MTDISFQELENLISLFDDRDSVVAECVEQRLKSSGHSVVRMLFDYAEKENNPSTKALIKERAESLNSEFRLEDFKDFTTRQHGPLSLFEAGFIICSFFDGRLNRDYFEELFFKCSGEYLAEHSDQRTGIENIRIFNHIFFHRLGFTVYDADISQEEFALVSRTLKTRKGNPFTLAYIYFMIAQVAGLPLKALCFPGGFVPVYVENGKELFYINVYRGGEIFLKDRLSGFLKATGLPVEPASFKLREDSSVTGIYLESLLFLFTNKKDEKKCSFIERALDCLGPERFLSDDNSFTDS